MHSAVAHQFGGFMADLRFVACLCALGLYTAWYGSRRPATLGMARLGLGVALGATLGAYALGPLPGPGLPVADLFLFLLLAGYLGLELMYRLPVLGPYASLVATLVASLPYWGPARAGEFPALAPVEAYWWGLRDLATTLGATAVLLGTGAAWFLYRDSGRRGNGDRRVHPDDLRDAVGLLGQGAVPAFFFGLVFETLAVLRAPHVTWSDAWAFGWLVGLLGVSGLWVAQAGRQKFGERRVLWLMLANLGALAAYSFEGIIFTGLAGGIRLH